LRKTQLTTRLNPLKRVNSILTMCYSSLRGLIDLVKSQSPQAGQFNSYAELVSLAESLKIESQSPQAGQFNSYPSIARRNQRNVKGLNPLKRVNSILTKVVGRQRSETFLFVSIPSSGSIQFLPGGIAMFVQLTKKGSQSPQAGQFNSYSRYIEVKDYVL